MRDETLYNFLVYNRKIDRNHCAGAYKKYYEVSEILLKLHASFENFILHRILYAYCIYVYF